MTNTIAITCDECGTRLIYDRRPDHRYTCCICHRKIVIIITTPLKDPRYRTSHFSNREVQKL